jgi:hypothetical protein
MNELEENGEEGSFQKFASQALRLQRKGSFEQLLAQHLIQSVSMDPLNKVRLVLEAAFIVPRDKLEIDWELAEAIYLATLGFLNTNIRGEFIAMAWGFGLTEDGFKRFIKPWHRDLPLAFAAGCDAETEGKSKRIQKTKGEAEHFFLFTNDLNLHSTSFQCLKSEFLRWSIPPTMQIFEKLSRLVDPDLYREMLQILKPKAGPE